MKYEPDIQKVAEEQSNSDEEKMALASILTFLRAFPETLVWRSKKNKPNLNDPSGLSVVGERYITALRKRIEPSTPKTVSDEMVAKILTSFYKYPENGISEIINGHRDAMVAENMVGGLLEAYINSELGKIGWVWCCDSLVKSIDFVKPINMGNDEWVQLQVKNRDNSENSSSSAVRDGTEIKKWFRTFSKTGKTNWGNFPDDEAKGLLSEGGFNTFVEEYEIN